MDPTLKFSILLLLLGFVNASRYKNGDFGQCERVVKRWAFSSLKQEVKEDEHTLNDLLFFLHVPRTGGRTYFHCFLRKLYSGSLECPRSYDKLRFDPRKQQCRLLGTHDDYSFMSKLPRERTSVMTILRDPVDRVFSSYEFSVEVAARFLMHPNLTSAMQMTRRIRSKSNGTVSTLDIWPWKYLVPWMREDLFARRDSQILRGFNNVKDSDPYNMEEVVMPLHEYINDPIAQDIVHNGETFQVAGLTNNSYLSESHEVRHCVQKYKPLGEYVLQVAKKRLDNMLYVGLTEEHRESVTMFAKVVGAQVISQIGGSNSAEETASRKSEQSYSDSDSKADNNERMNRTPNGEEHEIASPETVEQVKGNMTVEKLIEAYEDCVSSLRKSQNKRRISSLTRISPANFSKEARLQVPEVILQQIRELNHLDLELYKYAQNIFAKQHMRNFGITGILVRMLNSSYGTGIKVLELGGTVVLLVLFFFVFVNARRRRTSKVKV